jgi:hypothetical protein
MNIHSFHLLPNIPLFSWLVGYVGVFFLFVCLMWQINVQPDLFNTFLTTVVAVMYLCNWKLMYYQNNLPGLHTALFVCCCSLSGLALVFRCPNSPKASRSLPITTAPAPLHITSSLRCSNSPKASRSLPATTAPAPLHIIAPLSDTTTALQCLQCCCQSATAVYIFYLDHIKTSARD